MDQSSQYSSMSQQRQQLFPSPQLPPPTQLHLGTFRNNIPPPISHIPSNGRYPPPTYTHPSLSSTAAPLSSSLSSSTTLPWSSHRTSSSRDEISPSLRHSDSRSKLVDRDPPHEHSSSASHDVSPTKHEGEDGMPSTSDFVKKLYKYVLIIITVT